MWEGGGENRGGGRESKGMGHMWQRSWDTRGRGQCVGVGWSHSLHAEGLGASGWEQAPLPPGPSQPVRVPDLWETSVGTLACACQVPLRYFSLRNICELPESELGPEHGATTAHRTERNQDVFVGMLASATSSWSHGSHFKGVWNGCIWPRGRFGMISSHTLNPLPFLSWLVAPAFTALPLRSIHSDSSPSRDSLESPEEEA